MACDTQPLEQFKAAHSWQIGVDQQTYLAARTVGSEIFHKQRKPGRCAPIALQHVANALADVRCRHLDHENDRRRGIARRLFPTRRALVWRGQRRCEQPLDDLRQFLQLHRLVELHTVLKRDGAQSAARYVPG